MSKAKAILASAGYGHELGHATTILAVTPEILAAALRAYRAAKAQFMLSDEEASRMIAEAVLQAAS